MIIAAYILAVISLFASAISMGLAISALREIRALK